MILFICTGNYYRSRFAEIYFNHLAAGNGVPNRSISRGFEARYKRNKGPISKYTVRYLNELSIDFDPYRKPVQLMGVDLEKSARIILMDRTEHRPMMEKYFPDWNLELEYWNFQDVQFRNSREVLPEIRAQIDQLIHDYRI